MDLLILQEKIEVLQVKVELLQEKVIETSPEHQGDFKRLTDDLVNLLAELDLSSLDGYDESSNWGGEY